MTHQTSRWAAVLQPLSALLRPFRPAGSSPALIAPVPVPPGLAALDGSQVWRDGHPELSAALPGPREVIPVTEGEPALWLRMPDVPGDARVSVWLGLGDAAGYVLTRPGAAGPTQQHLLRYPREAVQEAFERRAPAWLHTGGDGCYGTYDAQFDWAEFTSLDRLLAFCRVPPVHPWHEPPDELWPLTLSEAAYVPGLSVVAHVPDSGLAVWSDGHHSEHLHDADSPRVVTGACLEFLELIEPERVVCPQRLDLLPHYAGLRAVPDFTPNPAAAPAQEHGNAHEWGHLTLTWRYRTEILPARAVSSEGNEDQIDYDFWFRLGDSWARNIWKPVATGPERRPGIPFQVRLDDSMLLPPHRTPQVTPAFLWPRSVTDLHLVLMWVQKLEMRLLFTPFSTPVLPVTFAQILVEAYGAELMPEDPTIPLTVVDTYTHWEGGFRQFCQDALSGVLDDAGLAAELDRRGLFRRGLGEIVLRHAAQDGNLDEQTRQALPAYAERWAARLAAEGDTPMQWVTYFQENLEPDPVLEESAPELPFLVKLDHSMIPSEDRMPGMMPVFLWPHSMTDLHLVLMWLQRLEEHLYVSRFSSTVLPVTFVHVLVEAYGAAVVPEDPTAPLTVVDTHEHWERGFDRFCRDQLGSVRWLSDAALAAELDRRGLFREGLGTLLLRGAAQETGAGARHTEEVLAEAQVWEAWVSAHGDTLTQWVTYLNDDLCPDRGEEEE